MSSACVVLQRHRNGLYNIRTPADPLPPRAHRAKRRYPILAVDPASGLSIVHVPLAGGQIATLDALDFKRLMALGISDQWVWNRDGKRKADGRFHYYVRASGADNLVMVARLILNEPGRARVRYHNGNPLDLRRTNLYVAALYEKPVDAVTAADAAGMTW